MQTVNEEVVGEVVILMKQKQEDLVTLLTTQRVVFEFDVKYL